MIKLKNKNSFFKFLLLGFLVVSIALIYFFKNFLVETILILFLFFVFLYLIYRKFKTTSDFEIIVDEKGISYRIPKKYAELYQIEHEKARYLWKQIKTVLYDNDNNVIYLILISKVKIPIPLIGLKVQEIEKILKEISKYTSVDVI